MAHVDMKLESELCHYNLELIAQTFIISKLRFLIKRIDLIKFDLLIATDTNRLDRGVTKSPI